jgi:hypothetical protein
MIFEDACDGIQSVGPDGLSVGSMDVDEDLSVPFPSADCKFSGIYYS